MELPLMLYSLIPQSSIEILSMELRMSFGGNIAEPQLIPAKVVLTPQICLKESLGILGFIVNYHPPPKTTM